VTTEDLVLRVGALKAIKEYVNVAYDQAREEIAAVMRRGDRLTARSPLDDTKIGSVSLTDPKPVARVSDMAALTVWLVENYPDLVADVYEVNATDEQVRALVFEHKPEWLTRKQRVDPRVLQQIRERSATAGEAVGPTGELDVPGVAVETPAPVVTCRPTADALDAVAALIRADRLGLDGVIRSLPGTEDKA
jgi:hypothetical protein